MTKQKLIETIEALRQEDITEDCTTVLRNFYRAQCGGKELTIKQAATRNKWTKFDLEWIYGWFKKRLEAIKATQEQTNFNEGFNSLTIEDAYKSRGRF